jgi:hypothetical protein
MSLLIKQRIPSDISIYPNREEADELDKPENLSRVDGMIGLKFYFE